MSTLKISQLTPITSITSNTSNTYLVGTDAQSGVSGKITATALANGLYANNVLNVGNNAILLPNVVAQFALNGQSYIQTNLMNTNDGGSADIVITANTGTDSTYFIDMGYVNKDYQPGSEYNNIGTSVNRLDGYLYIQGSTSNTWGGNLIVGTTSTGKEIRFIAGGGSLENVVAKMSNTTVTFQRAITFADGTSQNTSSGSAQTYANGAFIQSNSAFTHANSGFVHANSAYTKANNALANTSGTFAGDLFITGKANVGAQMFIANSTYDYTNTALVKIVGSTGAFYQPPVNPGYMLSITGIDGVASRVVNSSYGTGAYSLFAGRKGNGTAGSPTAVANNDVIARFSGSGYNGSAFTTTGQGRIDIVADEDFTTANNGSRIEFYNTIPKTNTVTKIATFNANTVTFTGAVQPMKGFVWSPRVPAGNQTAITIDYSTDSIIKANLVADLTVSHSNYVAGKIIEMWLTNNDNSNHTVTHGCAALRSTNKATTFTITAGSSAYLRYFSINGDNANTFVTITA